MDCKIPFYLIKVEIIHLNNIEDEYLLNNKNNFKKQLTMSSITNKYASNHIFSEFIDPDKLHLFVKAGQDGRSQGACPFCQDAFMQLLIKANENRFNFDVITINLDNPPREFRELSIKPPVLFYGNNFNKDHKREQSTIIRLVILFNLILC